MSQLLHLYTRPFRQYFDFKGRSGRAEFWLFALINLIAVSLLFWVDRRLGLSMTQNGPGVLGSVFFFAMVIPFMAVAVRRLHDTGKRGWWALLALGVVLAPFALIVLFFALGGYYSLLVWVPVFGSIVTFLVFMIRKGDQDENRYGPAPG